MTIAGIKPGDLIRVERNGEPSHYAEVVTIGPSEYAPALRKGEIMVETLCGHRIRTVTARQIVGHWRKRKARSA